MRLDHELVRRGLLPSRSAAKRAIVEGRVHVSGTGEPRPATHVDETTMLQVDPEATRYVGRGGHKLAAALDALDISIADRSAVDVGAATGGFTDCLLQRGARTVVAVDVGSGQLHADLRADARVTSVEQTDVRALDLEAAGGPFDVVVVDVSFVSVRLLAHAVARCLGPRGDLIVLVKPQFESGPDARTKRGVVTDPALRRRATRDVVAAFEEEGLAVMGSLESPVMGSAGNRESLVWFRRSEVAAPGIVGQDGRHG